MDFGRIFGTALVFGAPALLALMSGCVLGRFVRSVRRKAWLEALGRFAFASQLMLFAVLSKVDDPTHPALATLVCVPFVIGIGVGISWNKPLVGYVALPAVLLCAYGLLIWASQVVLARISSELLRSPDNAYIVDHVTYGVMLGPNEDVICIRPTWDRFNLLGSYEIASGKDLYGARWKDAHTLQVMCSDPEKLDTRESNWRNIHIHYLNSANASK